MNGNPFRQLSLLRQGVEMNTKLIQMMIIHLGLETSDLYNEYLPLIEQLEESNNKIVEILKQEYPEEYETL